MTHSTRDRPRSPDVGQERARNRALYSSRPFDHSTETPQDATQYGRSAEGIGDYGGYGGGPEDPTHHRDHEFSSLTYGRPRRVRADDNASYRDRPLGAIRDQFRRSAGARDQAHRGKGPKGYRRSDERLTEIISEQLMDADLDAGDITVSVIDGAVTLIGTVRDRSDRFRAEELTARSSGLIDIDNQLRIRSAGSAQRPTVAAATSDHAASRTEAPEVRATPGGTAASKSK